MCSNHRTIHPSIQREIPWTHENHILNESVISYTEQDECVMGTALPPTQHGIELTGTARSKAVAGQEWLPELTAEGGIFTWEGGRLIAMEEMEEPLH